MTVLSRLTPEQLKSVKHPINSTARRMWVNEVPRYERHGIWLDEVTPTVRDATLEVLRASLSAGGYEKSRNIMKLNGFLGDLVGAPIALGEFCYQFHIFGEPSSTAPWGWQLFGHHLCLTCFIVGTQMTLTPTFMGAEPRYADTGPIPASACSMTRSASGWSSLASCPPPSNAKPSSTIRLCEWTAAWPPPGH